MRYTLELDTTDAEDTALAHAVKLAQLQYVPPPQNASEWLLLKLREKVAEATGQEESAFVADVAQAIAADPVLKEQIREKLPTKGDGLAEAAEVKKK